jgi:hypothetical protein
MKNQFNQPYYFNYQESNGHSQNGFQQIQPNNRYSEPMQQNLFDAQRLPTHNHNTRYSVNLSNMQRTSEVAPGRTYNQYDGFF